MSVLNKENLFTAIEGSLAIIVFDSQGNISWANTNFARVIGYDVEELKTMQHRQLCLDVFTHSHDYVAFWDNLRKNKIFHDKVERVNKEGRVLWLDALYTPVINEEGKIENIIKIATDITKQEKVLRSSSDEFMTLVKQMTMSTNEVYRISHQAVKGTEKLTDESDIVKKDVKKIKDISTTVKNIAAQSQILGLNASIEAARAGEHGRGFSVVANEVQKMAKSSKNSAEEIEVQLENIANSVELMAEVIQQVTNNINKNSVSIGELKKAYENVTRTAEKLSTLI